MKDQEPDGNSRSAVDRGFSRPRVAVVSPFLDKQHGTERGVAEQIERLADDYEIHLYSSAVQDVDLSKIVWHRVPALPGPHLFAYCWWIFGNYLRRSWDARFRGLAPAMVFSPGINCFDADLISVHVVFGAYLCRAGEALRFRKNSMRSWPGLLHRRTYYRLAMVLEHLVYGGNRIQLTVVSSKTARDLKRYGREESDLPVIVHGVDTLRFNGGIRMRLRDSARQALGFNNGDFCLLLVGNDWKNKGLDCLLEALSRLTTPSIRLLVVGRDMAAPYGKALAQLDLSNRVTFQAPRPDVGFYYAAADLYVGPSLEDAFGMPPLEAMACGVPSIVSRQAGVSEIITDGVDGFILDDPRDSRSLADLIALLYRNAGLRRRIGEAAAQTAQKYTWDRNAEQLGQLFREVLRRKGCERVVVSSGQSAR